MANYGYIDLKGYMQGGKAWKPSVKTFPPVLEAAVSRALGDRWKVSLADFKDGGHTWLVTLPGTATSDAREAARRWAVTGQDVGFAVALQRGPTIAFRHGGSHFERWAQGSVEEELADYFRRGVLYDATDETVPPRTRYYRASSFQAHLTKRFSQGKKMTDKDREFLDGFRKQVPEGHW